MFWVMTWRPLVKGWRKKALAALTVTIGTALAVAMLNVSLDVGDKVGRELKDYGANIVVTPKAEGLLQELRGSDLDAQSAVSYLSDDDIPKLKTIFWQHNIVGFAPYLEVSARSPDGGRVPVVGTWFRKTLVIPTGETVTTGVADLKSWWRVAGSWPDDEAGGQSVLVGEALARQLSLEPGDNIPLTFGADGDIKRDARVSGIVAAGGEEDKRLFVPLSWLQEVSGRQGKVSRVEVSALTMPKNELARKAEDNPDALTRDEFDTWYCSPYVDSVAYQIEEAIPGARARPVRQVSESEGIVLGKMQLLMGLLAVAAVASSSLAIAGLMGAAALERSAEIGLLKALGASNSSVTWLFFAEAAPVGLFGGGAGFAFGLGLAMFMAQSVFRASLEPKLVTLPVAFAIALGVTLLGLLSVARIISRLEPARILMGR